MYTLAFPRKEINCHLIINYTDINNSKHIITISPENDIFIDKIQKINSIKNYSGTDFLQHLKKYIYKYDSYTQYVYLLNNVKEWLRKNPKDVYLKKYKLTLSNKDQIKLLTDILIPTIESLLHFNNQVFIRHGLEIHNEMNYDKDSNFPITNATCWNNGDLFINLSNDEIFWDKKKQSDNCKKCFPIEIDILPFCSSIDAYKNRKWPCDKQYGYCSNHDALFSWNKLKGYIPYSLFLQKGGKVVTSGKRDHLYAYSEIKSYDWLYVFQNITHKKEESKYWGWTQKNFSADNFKNDIRKIILNNGKIISQELIFLIYKLNWVV